MAARNTKFSGWYNVLGTIIKLIMRMNSGNERRDLIRISQVEGRIETQSNLELLASTDVCFFLAVYSTSCAP